MNLDPSEFLLVLVWLLFCLSLGFYLAWRIGFQHLQNFRISMEDSRRLNEQLYDLFDQQLRKNRASHFQVTGQKKQISRLTSSITSSRAELSVAHRLLQRSKRKVGGLAKKLAKKQERITGLQTANELGARKILEMESLISQNAQDRTQALDQLRDALTANDGLEATVSSLTSSLRELEDALAQSLSRVSDLETTLSENEIETAAMRAQLAEPHKVRSRLEVSQQCFSSVQQERDALVAENRKFSTQKNQHSGSPEPESLSNLPLHFSRKMKKLQISLDDRITEIEMLKSDQAKLSKAASIEFQRLRTIIEGLRSETSDHEIPV